LEAACSTIYEHEHYRGLTSAVRADQLSDGSQSAAMDRRVKKKKKKTIAAPMTHALLAVRYFPRSVHSQADNPTLAMGNVTFGCCGNLDKLKYKEAWIGEHHSGRCRESSRAREVIDAGANAQHHPARTGVSSMPYHNLHARRADRPARSHDAGAPRCSASARLAVVRRQQDRHRTPAITGA